MPSVSEIVDESSSAELTDDMSLNEITGDEFDYRLGKKIGSGSFGDIFDATEVRDEVEGRQVAVKAVVMLEGSMCEPGEHRNPIWCHGLVFPRCLNYLFIVN